MVDAGAELISTADIARLAGQSRATVGNWKARYPDFPVERRRNPRGPLYDRSEVVAWLEATNRLDNEAADAAALWRVADQFRGQVAPEDVLGLVLALLALRSASAADWEDLRGAAPPELNQLLGRAVSRHLPDARILLPPTDVPPHLLAAAIDALSSIRPNRVAAMADAVLEQSAKVLGSRGGEFLTPLSVRRLVVALADPVGTVYNPGSGAGQLLVEVAERGQSRGLELYGQEINQRVVAMSKINLTLHGVEAHIASGDVFFDDGFRELRADRVVSVPPWGVHLPADRLAGDPRWVWGEPGPNDGDSAWIQHCLAHLKSDGRAVIVLPKGAVFKAGRGRRILQGLIRAGLLEAVVALPAKMFARTSIPSAVFVFRAGRVELSGDPDPILMIDLDASATGSSSTLNVIDDSDIEMARSIYERWLAGEEPTEGNAGIATYEEVAENDFVLDPARYVSLRDTTPDPAAARERHGGLLVELREKSALAQRAAEEVLALGQLSPFSAEREVRLGDLLVASTATMSRGFPTQRSSPAGIPVMSVAALRSGSQPRHFANSEDLEDLSLDLALPADVLIAVEGGTVGESMMVTGDEDSFVPSQQVAIVRVIDPAVVDPWYLGAWLASEQGRDRLRRLSRGSGIQRIALKDLGSLPIPLPPMNQQAQTGRHFRALENLIHRSRTVLESADQVRDAALALTFSEVD